MIETQLTKVFLLICLHLTVLRTFLQIVLTVIHVYKQLYSIDFVDRRNSL